MNMSCPAAALSYHYSGKYLVSYALSYFANIEVPNVYKAFVYTNVRQGSLQSTYVISFFLRRLTNFWIKTEMVFVKTLLISSHLAENQ